ncbi:MAG: 7-cyano-7-deazaguanine synthase [Myxococcota bacterium]|nr:7-cyano-7-deazaguanine synthase [Myxococcota bacterium]
MLHLSPAGMHKNASLKIAGLERHHLENVPPAMVDFLSIASYLYIAERMGRLSTDAEPAPRCFRLVIGVQNPDFWHSLEVKGELEKVLRVLCRDRFSFEFRQCPSPSLDHLCCVVPSPTPPRALSQNDVIMLLSGGLDSLGGAADLVLEKKQRVIAISHRTSNLTWKTQDALVDALSRKPGTLRPVHIPFRVVPYDNQYRKERPQHTSALLYSAVAGVIAAASGITRIYFHKNGICSLGFSAPRQRHPLLPVRTTHPQVLFRLSRILSMAAGLAIKIENPFENKTRSEIANAISNSGLAPMMRETVSCAESPFGSPVHHCGTCDTCIDRRFALLASGLDTYDADYNVGLTSRQWEKKPHRSRLLFYIAAAEGFAAVRDPFDFVNQHGTRNATAHPDMKTRAICQKIFEMHRRHGHAVGQVVSRLSKQLSKDTIEGRVQTNQSLIMLTAEGLRRSSFPAPPPIDDTKDLKLRDDSKNVFLNLGDYWIMRFGGGPTFTLKFSKGLIYIRWLIKHPNRTFTAYDLIDLGEGREPSGRPPAADLSIDQKAIANVKESLHRLKTKLELATDVGDMDTVTRCEQKMASLTAYLISQTRPDGRPKKHNPRKEKARFAVTKAISRALKRIRANDKSMAGHLSTHIKTGFNVTYTDPDTQWEA